MPKNAVQRLKKIENDLKTVISIYEVSKRKNNQSQTQDGWSDLSQNSTQEVLRVQQPLQFDFSSNTASIAQPIQNSTTESVQCRENWELEKPPPLSCGTSSTISEIFCVKTKDSRNLEKRDTDVINNRSTSKSEKGKDQNVIAENSSFVKSSKENSILKEHPGRLIHTTSNWFGSVKHSSNRKCSSLNPNLTAENVPRMEGEKNRVKNKISDKDFFGINNEKKIKCKRLNIYEKKKVPHSQSYNDQKTQKAIDNGELRAIELSKMIEKSNEKLEKMKLSKGLALDIAKRLKEKYDEIQQSKQELMETLIKVQRDNERMRNELQDAQMKIKELKESKITEIEQDVINKEIVEESIKKLKARICELEKELIQRQQEIEKIQRARLTESQNKENQAKNIQRLCNEKYELLATNDELVILLTDCHLEKKFLEQKIHQLEEELQMQKQHLKKKTKTLQEANTELESIRQTSTDFENQVKILRKDIENYEETQKYLTKRTEEYEQHAKINQEEITKLQDENLKLKTELENERDALLIKTKIIEDQQESIKQMKEKLFDEKKRKESLEKILNVEREEKLELEEALERLKWRREELKKKIKVLESDLLLAPQKVAEDLQKTQTLLFNLENQVHSKQKEWELQLRSLIKEKEQACSVAEYATRKLIQTSSEFQKQSEAHQRLCRILTENLAKKTENLKCVQESRRNPENLMQKEHHHVKLKY